ncbi:MAG TPA: hypothetical protein VIE66_11750 [Methylocella sp.]
MIVPAIGVAQENGKENKKKEEPGIVTKVIEDVTGRSAQEADKNVDANKRAVHRAGDGAGDNGLGALSSFLRSSEKVEHM